MGLYCVNSFSTKKTPSFPEEINPSSCFLSVPFSLPRFSGQSKKLSYSLSTSYPYIRQKTFFSFLNTYVHTHIHAQQINCGPKLREIGSNFYRTQLRATRWCFNLIFLTFPSKLKSNLRH